MNYYSFQSILEFSWCRLCLSLFSHGIIIYIQIFRELPTGINFFILENIIVETSDPFGPFGAKEVGQGPIQCTTQAIANAVSNAIGYPLTELPITPERILRALKEKQQS